MTRRRSRALGRIKDEDDTNDAIHLLLSIFSLDLAMDELNTFAVGDLGTKGTCCRSPVLGGTHGI